MKQPEKPLPQEMISPKQLKRRQFISFSVVALLPVASWSVWKWVSKQPKISGAPKPLRDVLNTNEKVFSALFDTGNLVKEYPASKATKNVRVNGSEGLHDNVDMAVWRLQVLRENEPPLQLTLDQLKALPKKEIAFDFKCIEGWSQVSQWGGLPFKTFMEHFNLQQQAKYKYVSLQTPDKKYYVGIDMASALHPQTLLCYEMNGQPLPAAQGFPLRLIIPVKYGIKHLKCIGTLAFSDEKPRDYWAERGYDYYAGH